MKERQRIRRRLWFHQVRLWMCQCVLAIKRCFYVLRTRKQDCKKSPLTSKTTCHSQHSCDKLAKPLRLSSRQLQHAIESNPYLQSKVLWNECYGSLQTKLDNSYRIIAVLCLVLLAAISGLVVIAGQTRVKPFVTIIHGHQVLAAETLTSPSISRLKPRLALYFAKQFIRDSRTISSDGVMNTQHQIAAYAFVRSEALSVLHDYFTHHPRDSLAKEVVSSVTITSVLRNSPQSLTIRWQESIRDVHSGQVLRVVPYLAQVSYRYVRPSHDEQILKTNPFGFVITYLSWSRINGDPLT